MLVVTNTTFLALAKYLEDESLPKLHPPTRLRLQICKTASISQLTTNYKCNIPNVANSWIHNYFRNKPYYTPMLRESSIPIHQNADTRLTSWVISCMLRAKEARMAVSSSTINKEILFKFLFFFF